MILTENCGSSSDRTGSRPYLGQAGEVRGYVGQGGGGACHHNFQSCKIPREVAGRIVQSVWRVFGQAGKEESKTVGQNKKGFRTLEIEGGNPPPNQVSPNTVQG